MMIFCRDCRWHNTRVAWECGKIVGYQSTYRKPKEAVVTDEFAFEKNKDGDCADYKRKWWKFWRKPAIKVKEVISLEEHGEDQDEERHEQRGTGS